MIRPIRQALWDPTSALLRSERKACVSSGWDTEARPSQCCSDAAAPRGVQAGSTTLDHDERCIRDPVVARISLGRILKQSAAEKPRCGFQCASWRSRMSQIKASAVATWGSGSCIFKLCEAVCFAQSEKPYSYEISIRCVQDRTVDPGLQDVAMSRGANLARALPITQRRGGAKMNRSCKR
ncbi:hypothetical protein L1887_55619 [Cichorium endivia]|nr:hypothetical protein L1887_55619 [Cichorium endivia]